MSAPQPYAVISCDLDTVDRHLQGYGFEGLPPCDRIYRTAVPRLLELFEALEVPGVLFTIARDAESERGLLRAAVAAGHEVASHSLTHPQPFRTLSDAALREEIRTSRARLTEARSGPIACSRGAIAAAMRTASLTFPAPYAAEA